MEDIWGECPHDKRGGRMRELKFRVWSEEDKEYRPDIKVSDLAIDIDGVPSTIYSNEGDRFDIEQYTGLKDKNGKEIYEGDIVEIFGDIARVSWLDDGCCFHANNDDGYIATIYLVSKHGVVIGNIHENPELSEEEE